MDSRHVILRRAKREERGWIRRGIYGSAATMGRARRRVLNWAFRAMFSAERRAMNDSCSDHGC